MDPLFLLIIGVFALLLLPGGSKGGGGCMMGERPTTKRPDPPKPFRKINRPDA